MTSTKPSPFVQTIVYTFGAIIGGWGSFEILLRVDPFAALWLRNLVFLGVAIALIALVLMALHFRGGALMDARGGRLRIMTVAAAFGVGLAFGPLFWRLPQLDQWPSWSDGLAIVAALSLSVGAGMACLTYRCATSDGAAGRWPDWLEVPMLVAALALGLVIIFVASGRAKNLTQGDIAQEELRQGGLEFSMSSLQEALFLVSPRSVELFRKANVDERDIREALGTKTTFADDKPLVTSILARLDSDNGLDCSAEHEAESESGKSCERIDEFVRLFDREKEARDLWEFLMMIPGRPNDVQRLCFGELPEDYDKKTVCSNLNAEIPPRIPDGAPPRPLLSHAVGGGHANVTACLLELCGVPDPSLDIRPTRSDHAGAAIVAQTHILSVLDLAAAVEYAWKQSDGRWSRDEVDRVLAARPSGAGGHFLMLPNIDDCAQCIPAAPRSASIVTIDGETCTIAEATLAVDAEPTRLEAGDEWEVTQALAALTPTQTGRQLPALLQVRTQEDRADARLVYAADVADEAELAVFGWGDAGQGESVWLLDGRDGHVLLKQKPPTQVEGVRLGLEPHLIKASAGVDLETFGFQTAKPSSIRIMGRAQSDLCLVVRSGVEAQSRYVRVGQGIAFETTQLPSSGIFLDIAILSDADETKLSVAATPPLPCELSPDEPTLLDSKASAFSYVIENGGDRSLTCAFHVDKPALVRFEAHSFAEASLTLKGGSIDDASKGLVGEGDAPLRASISTVLAPNVDYRISLSPDSGFGEKRVRIDGQFTWLPESFDALRPSSFPEEPPIIDAGEIGGFIFNADRLLLAVGFDGALLVYPPAGEPVRLVAGAPFVLPRGSAVAAVASGERGSPLRFLSGQGEPLEREVIAEPPSAEEGLLHLYRAEHSGEVTITLTDLDADLDLHVSNAVGVQLEDSMNSGVDDDHVTFAVEAQESYIVRVQRYQGAKSKYRLTASLSRDDTGR